MTLTLISSGRSVQALSDGQTVRLLNARGCQPSTADRDRGSVEATSERSALIVEVLRETVGLAKVARGASDLAQRKQRTREGETKVDRRTRSRRVSRQVLQGASAPARSTPPPPGGRPRNRLGSRPAEISRSALSHTSPQKA